MAMQGAIAMVPGGYCQLLRAAYTVTISSRVGKAPSASKVLGEASRNHRGMARTMSDAIGGVTLNGKTRAQRFGLQIPLRYRTDSEGGWRKGTTRNISRSGMLFHGEDWAPPKTRIELTLLIPQQLGVERVAEVICRGRVTRSELRDLAEGGSLMAIQISNYRLVRPKEGPRLEANKKH